MPVLLSCCWLLATGNAMSYFPGGIEMCMGGSQSRTVFCPSHSVRAC
jgi:hypothetical protein